MTYKSILKAFLAAILPVLNTTCCNAVVPHANPVQHVCTLKAGEDKTSSDDFTHALLVDESTVQISQSFLEENLFKLRKERS